MELYAPQRLSGMIDLGSKEYALLTGLQSALQNTLNLHGYATVDTPLIELTELFLRKSGGELASRMYSFIDPGGRSVSLRPEFTAPVIRSFINSSAQHTLPVRWQYAGPVFRFDSSESSGRRQFTQLGAELIGASGSYADAEIIALACQTVTSSPATSSITNLKLVISDVNAMYQLLSQFKLSERAVIYLLNNFGNLKGSTNGVAELKEQAKLLGLFQSDAQNKDLDALVHNNTADDRSPLTRTLLGSTVIQQIGVRTPEEVVDRLLRKIRGADSEKDFTRALVFARSLANLKGDPVIIFEEVRELSKQFQLDCSPLISLEQTLQILSLYPLRNVKVTLDLGLTRGIAYYTGIVFEILHDADRPTGGGGRYDSLIKALGNEDNVAALGFAYTLEHILRISEPTNHTFTPAQIINPILVIPEVQDAFQYALELAQSLRNDGKPVEISSMFESLKTQIESALQRGIKSCIVVDENGKCRNQKL